MKLKGVFRSNGAGVFPRQFNLIGRDRKAKAMVEKNFASYFSMACISTPEGILPPAKEICGHITTLLVDISIYGHSSESVRVWTNSAAPAHI